MFNIIILIYADFRSETIPSIIKDANSHGKQGRLCLASYLASHPGLWPWSRAWENPVAGNFFQFLSCFFRPSDKPSGTAFWQLLCMLLGIGIPLKGQCTCSQPALESVTGKQSNWKAKGEATTTNHQCILLWRITISFRTLFFKLTCYLAIIIELPLLLSLSALKFYWFQMQIKFYAGV